MNVRSMSDIARAALRCSVPLALAVGSASSAAAASTDSALYLLTDASAYEVGCFACACPVRSSSFQGSFRLRFVSADPQFSVYAVEHLDAVVLLDGKPTPVTGSGEYRIGGEVALMQELKLELVIGDRGPQNFDSGLAPGGAEFPAAIAASVAAHGFACFDTAFRVDAKQSNVGVPDPRRGGPAARAIPNPFRDRTELRFAMPVAASATVSILDAQGRELRSLVRGARLEAGPQRLLWDGRAEDGASAPPGLYFARLSSPAAAWSRRLVKLE
ncbi:MAG TPA: FlgD immunoglobulin-like domain containing protein [Candidatus Eisenbacteria bacterium]|jgi:hypothetical protein